MKRTACVKTAPIFLWLFFLLSGCAASSHQHSADELFADMLGQYPQTREPLEIQRLSEASFAVLPPSRRIDVSIIVHPAYAVFFDSSSWKDFSEAKYSLIKKQFSNEAKFVKDQAQFGNIVILILPAGSLPGGGAAGSSYTSYLNTVSLKKQSVYYLFSEMANKGALPAEDMVTLYRFLQAVKAEKVLIGGGYIGRCQSEFMNQLVKYFNAAQTYVVPEISTISPEDVSEKEAALILSSFSRQDYTPVKSFISRKTEGNANILSILQ